MTTSSLGRCGVTKSLYRVRRQVDDAAVRQHSSLFVGDVLMLSLNVVVLVYGTPIDAREM